MCLWVMLCIDDVYACSSLSLLCLMRKNSAGEINVDACHDARLTLVNDTQPKRAVWHPFYHAFHAT